ncbi:hypothetical protein A8B98_12215 [Hymenobacter sp. UV11]|nr:hypothetical protein A8B98_12215 [Hymenobacter sp. UV11]
MYTGEKYDYRWFPMFWKNSKYFLSRNGLSTLYRYFYKDVQDVENISSISRLWQIEMWKAHFQMRTEYSSFIDSLSKLANILKEQRIYTQKL